MSDKNLTQRLLVIVAVILLGALMLRDPRQTLRAGNDIAGGTSLIFELDTTEAENDPTLAERVKEQLQRRVDPKGVYDIQWRVHGRNRLEVQMPLPPKDARARLEAYRTALDALYAYEITRGTVERALRLPPEERAEAIQKLAERNAPAALASATTTERAAIEAGIAKRAERLRVAAERYDAYLAAKAALDAATATAPAETTPPETAPAETAPAAIDPTAREAALEAYRNALESWEEAIHAVLATNVNRRRFQELLDLDANSQVRRLGMESLRNEHADLRAAIDAVVAAHAKWRSGKQALDGPADLKRQLRGAGQLEFRILAENDLQNPMRYERYRKQLREDGVPRRPGDPEGWFQIDNPMQFFSLDRPEQLEELQKKYRDHFYVVERIPGDRGDDWYVLAKTTPEFGLLQHQPNQRPWRLTRAREDRDEHGRWCVRFQLDPIGGQYFERLTSANINKPLCIIVDNVAYSAANIQSAISTSGQITGEFSVDKVMYLVRTMEGGMLPARLKDTPLSERTIGSSLGEANRDAAIRAGLIGTAAVVLIMLVYYLVCGAIANVALFLNVFLTLAALAMLNARITLDGVAGIILSVGMTVDANVLIYERMREEKARGSSLRMVVKNGFDKAFSTIFDSNITTLLTCLIIYYVGSEEVKGFGLTLGWGVALNMFTAVFVTRTLFGVLLKLNLLKDIKMMRVISVPNIDWCGKRNVFLGVSAVVLVAGLSVLFVRGRDVFDVEFRGGAQVEFELKPGSTLDDAKIGAALRRVSEALGADAARVAQAGVTPVPNEPGVFKVDAPGVDPYRVAALIAEPLEEAGLLLRGGGALSVFEGALRVRVPLDVTPELLTARLRAAAADGVQAARELATASINAVLETGGVAQRGLVWNLTTTVTNMRLVERALLEALGDDMQVQPSITFELAGGRPLPVVDRLIEAVVPNLPPGTNYDLTDYLGGVAFHLQRINPPQTLAELRSRLDNIHFQPDFVNVPKRDFDVLGIAPAGDGPEGQRFSEVVVVAVDPELRFSEDPDRWASALASVEQRKITTALTTEQTLRKMMQFKPQIAARSAQQATIALILSWAMIIGYVWIRFGKPIYGVAGVAALIHDVLVALSFIGFSYYLASWGVGERLLVSDFKVNMPIIAALLTIIGFSINDTIVIFDRVREIRGRLGFVTPQIVNDSINQCMSRTLLTTFTVLLVVLIMYVYGGSSIRGFNYTMLIGCLSGVYSTIVIAGPLLLLARSPATAAQRAAAR